MIDVISQEKHGMYIKNHRSRKSSLTHPGIGNALILSSYDNCPSIISQQEFLLNVLHFAHHNHRFLRQSCCIFAPSLCDIWPSKDVVHPLFCVENIVNKLSDLREIVNEFHLCSSFNKFLIFYFMILLFAEERLGIGFV